MRALAHCTGPSMPMRAACEAAGPNAVGFFYYSGHGAADAGINYLIPVDVKSAEDRRAVGPVAAAHRVTRKLKSEAGNATHFVVFDACRNTLKLRRRARGRWCSRKASCRSAQESGMLIAYATAEGELASDVGAGAGPYAKVLAEEIIKPGIEAVTCSATCSVGCARLSGRSHISASMRWGMCIWRGSSRRNRLLFRHRSQWCRHCSSRRRGPGSAPRMIMECRCARSFHRTIQGHHLRRLGQGAHRRTEEAAGRCGPREAEARQAEASERPQRRNAWLPSRKPERP